MDDDAVNLDQGVRLAAFRFLAEQTQVHGEVLPRAILATGFTFDGTRVPLIGPQGIFKPANLPEMRLRITTGPIVEERRHCPYGGWRAPVRLSGAPREFSTNTVPRVRATQARVKTRRAEEG